MRGYRAQARENLSSVRGKLLRILRNIDIESVFGDIKFNQMFSRFLLRGEEKVKVERRKFHEIRWERGETQEWLNGFFQIAGIGRFTGEGRIPPALTKELVWAIEHLKKYPEPGKGREKKDTEAGDLGADEWVLVEEPVKDLLAFI